MIKKIISLFILAVIAIFGLNYLREPKVSQDIYTITASDIHGKSISFKEYKEKPLLLYFWTTWDTIATFEAKSIENLSKDYSVVTIAVNSGSTRGIKKYMNDNNLTYPVINDNQGNVASKFDIKVFPTTIIYDKKNKIKFSEVGYTTPWGLKARLKLSE